MAKVLPNSLKITFAMSFVVVFPFEPVIPIVFPLNLFLLNSAKFINAASVFFTNNPLYFRALSLRDTITPEAPFCIAFSKKSCPSKFLPFIAINKSFFSIERVSILIPVIFLLFRNFVVKSLPFEALINSCFVHKISFIELLLTD